MTEEEAKTKWCPFARVVSSIKREEERARPAINRVGGRVDDQCLCLASGCMAWRRRGARDNGYCGLAGIES